jgi:osmoprotectant transport system ATP-binding protein
MLMDEPFSAVDPVVRHQLQEEFLRLQADLRKTIVFVTHDIDEAVKLGDAVAVMRVGGKLAQLAPPGVLLTEPVDDFVAGFVGRDRGYRALSFEQAGSLPTRKEETARLGSEVAAAARVADDGWVLIVDDDQRPLGWLAPAVARPGAIESDMLHRGGTVASEGGTLRAALDAALSSPSGRGVIVGEDDRLIGSITAAEVVARIDHRAEAARTARTTAGAASEAAT